MTLTALELCDGGAVGDDRALGNGFDSHRGRIERNLARQQRNRIVQLLFVVVVVNMNTEICLLSLS